MNSQFPRIRPLGERAIVIEFEPVISEKTLQIILELKDFISKKLLKHKVEVNTTYTSLLVRYISSIENIYDGVYEVEQLVEEANIGKNNRVQLFHIPVCYELDFGLDLPFLAKKKSLSFEQIIELHTAPEYTVYFLGFLPGFLYLGGLDEKLHISRKDQPRLKVEKGAVGIGEKQTGIYPQNSPGGWQIIGNSPVPLFDSSILPPCEISAGSRIKFYAVTKEEHLAISEEVKRGEFQFKKEIHES